MLVTGGSDGGCHFEGRFQSVQADGTGALELYSVILYLIFTECTPQENKQNYTVPVEWIKNFLLVVILTEESLKEER